MKYLIISDIHGSYYYLNKALKVFKKEKCDKILILGDVLYHGPRNDLIAATSSTVKSDFFGYLFNLL